MAEMHGRFVNTALWRDDWFLSLRESEQHLFTYLLICPASELCGIYRLGLAEAAFHTKIDQAEIKRIFTERFEPDGKAFFELGYVVMVNWLKHQRLNTNMWKTVQNEINALPDWLRAAIFDSENRLFIPLDRHSHGRLTIPNGNEPLATIPNPSVPLDEREAKEKLKGKGNGKEAKSAVSARGDGKNHLDAEARKRLYDGKSMP